MDPEPYDSVWSPRATELLQTHFDLGANLYKFWASPRSVARALLHGWARARHPAHLHYAWDLERAPSLDFGILDTTRRAVALLDLEGVRAPRLFEPGCGIGGGVTQVGEMLPHASVTGMSLVANQLQIGRAMALARGLQNTVFVRGNYLATPFPADHFDGIFAIESLVYTPTSEKGALCRELFRILSPGRTFVSLDGFSLRDARTLEEKGWVRDVMEGWTLPLPSTPREFQEAARAAGFEVAVAEEATSHVRASARRIAAIGKSVLRPLAALARVPLLRRAVEPFGFRSPAHAWRFVDACSSQVKVFESGLGAYFIHVFRKP